MSWFGLRFRSRPPAPHVAVGAREWGCYVLFDWRGRVLYVGKSFEPGGRGARFREHARKWWWPLVRRWEWRPSNPNTQAAAYKLEAELIVALRPACNDVLNGGRGSRLARLARSR